MQIDRRGNGPPLEAAESPTVGPRNGRDRAVGRDGDAAAPRTLLEGRFELRRELGAGAFGQVYEAHDRERDALLALKVLTRVDADSLYRFKREFRAIANVFHPNIVTLHELFAGPDGPFFTMELVPGVDFVRWARAGLAGEADDSFTTDDTLLASDRAGSESGRLRSALAQLVAGVQALHLAGIVHRDLKPSNVLVRADGRVAILDFGLVVSLDNERSAALIAGTPAYMAPEQARGEDVGPSADWYAVGGMLYEALTGHRPFEGSTLEVLRRKQTEAPAAPTVVNPAAPRDLSALCLRLLEAEPSRRPDARAILGELGPAPPIREPTRELFVGREKERAILAEAFSRVAPGSPSVALVHGPSGIGKSALLRSFVREVGAPSAIRLFGRCYEREQVPFKGLDGLVEAIARHLASLPSVDAAAFGPRDTDALVRLFPALLRVDPLARACRGKELPGDPIELRRRGARALREMLQRFGDFAPTVVLIDDAQWSDPDSAIVLADVLLPPDAPAVMLVLAYRDGDDDDVAAALLGALPREDVHLVDVALGALDERSAGDLARDAGGDVDVAHIVQESGGNPFFIRELAGASAEPASVSLEQLVLRRVRQLPAVAQRLLETIAVAGQPLAQAVALRAASLAGNDGLDALTTLRRESLIRARRGEHLEPYHDRIRETLTSTLDPGVLRERHTAIAAALGEDAQPQLMAYHLRMAGDREAARAYAEAAGDRAVALLAFDRAAEHFADAASGAGTPELLEKLAEAMIGAGRGREAAETFLRASAMRDGAAADDLRRRAAEQYFRTGLFEVGIETIRPLMAAVGLSIPASRWLTILLIYWNASLITIFGWRMTGKRDPLALRRAVLCNTMAYIGNYESHRAGLFMLAGVRHARRSGDPVLHMKIMGGVSLFLADEKLHHDVVATGASLPEARGVQLAGWRQFTDAILATSRGEVSRALDGFLAAERTFEGEQLAFERGLVRVWLMEGLWQRGRIREYVQRAREHLLECRNRGDLFGVAWTEAMFLRRAMLVEDRPADARELAERFASSAKSPDDIIPFLAQGGACECAAYTGDPVAARTARARLQQMGKGSLLMMPTRYNAMRAFAFGCIGIAALVEGRAKVAARAARKLSPSFGGEVLYGGVLRAGLARDADAGEAYDRAALALATEYPMHAEAARLRAAEIRGDARGCDEELDAIRARGVKNPRALANVLAPRAGTT